MSDFVHGKKGHRIIKIVMTILWARLCYNTIDEREWQNAPSCFSNTLELVKEMRRSGTNKLTATQSKLK